MNIHKMFPSKYVAAADLAMDGGKFRDVTVTMERIEEEKVGAPPMTDDKYVLYFTDAKKGLILNKTNATTIADLYGPETDNWRGNRITLFVEKVRYRKDWVDAIRIRPTIPPAKSNGGDTIPAPPPEQEEPDIDYAEDDHPFEDDARPQWKNRNQALLWAMDMRVCSDQPAAIAIWESVALEALGKKTPSGAEELEQVMDAFYNWAVKEMDKFIE